MQRAHVVLDELHPKVAQQILDVVVGEFLLFDGKTDHFTQRRLKPPHELTPRVRLANDDRANQRSIVERRRCRWSAHARAPVENTFRRRCATARSGVIAKRSRCTVASTDLDAPAISDDTRTRSSAVSKL